MIASGVSRAVGAWSLHGAAVALTILTLLAVTARGISALMPIPVSDALIALSLGILVGAVLHRESIRANVSRIAIWALRLGVALLGARLSLEAVLAIGLDALGLVVLIMGGTLLAVGVAGRRLGLPADLTTLLAVGMAVCGNSAIAAVAPVIRAKPQHIAVAMASVTLFGTAAVAAYPLIGVALAISDRDFGMWAGLAINDTSQVVAAATIYSSPALLVATVVKLVRNALMIPLLAFVAWRHRRGGNPERPVGRIQFVRRAVPSFVVGFLILASARSAGVLSDELVNLSAEASSLLISAALGGIGLSIRFGELTRIGHRPFTLSALAGITIAITSLAAVRVISTTGLD